MKKIVKQSKIYYKGYYKKNREKIRQRNKRWYIDNRDRLLKKQKNYNEVNKDKIKIYNKHYYKEYYRRKNEEI